MQYEISNGVISIAAVLKGAELVSLKKGDIEYLWQADPAVWNRAAPNLFPFVGKLNGGVYRYEGKTYPMTPHGFARDLPFALSKHTDTYLQFTLSDTAETRKVYPFCVRVTEINFYLKSSNVELFETQILLQFFDFRFRKTGRFRYRFKTHLHIR